MALARDHGNVSCGALEAGIMVVLSSSPSHRTWTPDPEAGLWPPAALLFPCQLNVERWNLQRRFCCSGPCPPPVLAATCALFSTL